VPLTPHGFERGSLRRDRPGSNRLVRQDTAPEANDGMIQASVASGHFGAGGVVDEACRHAIPAAPRIATRSGLRCDRASNSASRASGMAVRGPSDGVKAHMMSAARFQL
jgi:hypothetical protein